MEDVNISIYRASVVREGSTPASPGFAVSEGQNPVDPSGSGQNHLPVTIATAATGLSITESQVLGGAGTVGQYIRGDGSLADFPESSGGGSSVSYYLNGSVNQGTIGGVAYKELNKVPIIGTGTDFTIAADGYIASFITDAGDPNLLEIPAGNWNFETYFSASSSGGTPSFYVELYKVNSGGTATLIASNSGFPEFIAFGTIITSYFSTLAVPTTALALTDRLAIRYYVTHSGRTITLHTEDNHLCQIITTFTTGLTALNGLTAQVQNFAVGTSGTDFNIASATATHTFNLPTASATNRGALSSSDWTTFNGKVPYSGAVASVDLGVYSITANAINSVGSGSTAGQINLRSDAFFSLVNGYGSIASGTTNQFNLYQTTGAGVFRGAILSLNSITASATRTFTLPDADGTIALVGGAGVGTVTSVGLSSATSGITIGSTPVTTSGTITLAIATASGSQNGLLSSTDWTTFNSKQNALTNPVTGTGTTNYLPKFTGASTIGNSQIIDNGTNVGIGVSPSSKLFINTGGVGATSNGIGMDNGAQQHFWYLSDNTTSTYQINSSGGVFRWVNSNGELIRIFSDGNTFIGTSPSNSGFKLDVNGTGRFSGSLRSNSHIIVSDGTASVVLQGYINNAIRIAASGSGSSGGSRGDLYAGFGDFGGSLTSQQTNISADGAGVVLQGYVDNTLRIAVRGSGYNSGSRGGLLASTGDFSSSVTANTFVEIVGDLRFNSNSADRSIYFRGIAGSPDTNWKMGTYLTPTGATTVTLAATVIDVFGGASGYGFMVRNTSNAPLLQIAGDTGAATFSSSVTLTSGLLSVDGFANKDTNYITLRSGLSPSDSGGIGLKAIDHSGSSADGLACYGHDGISLYTAQIEKMRITSTGNIIVGYNQTTVTTIGRTFATTHASANRGATLFYGINDGSNGGMFVYNVASSASGYNSQYITFETHEGAIDAGERMRITTGGNVLIGTTTNGSSKLRLVGLPTSSVGLSSGDVYNLAGTLMIA